MNTKLTEREKQIICVAIETAMDKDKLIRALKDEYEEIKEKLTFELTQYGNRIRRGFSFASCSGSEMNIFGNLRSNGWNEFYYSAPYHWGVANIKEMKIFTYTEGDTAMIECKNKRTFKAEMKAHWDFFVENHSSCLDGDSVDTMKEAGLIVEIPKRD